MPPLSELTIAGFLDAATGKRSASGQGDYAAIATVGRDNAGHFYVLDVWLKRAAPTEQIRALFDLHERWNYWQMGIEGNCFQELLLLPIEEERRRRREAGSAAWQLPVRAVHHSRKKETRIATLEPLVANGWLQFAADLPQEFWRQFEAFPRGRHDDGIDAVEGAVSLLRTLEGDVHRAPHRKAPPAMRHF